MKRILIMAGGTGGHVFPGIAVARALQGHGIQIEWLGTRRGIEARLVPAEKIPLSFLRVRGLRGKRLGLLLAPFQLLMALMQAIVIIWRVKPDLVLGLGGFASGPGGVAAWLLRKPLVIHEQNAVAGFTNKVLARLAARVLQALPGTFPEKVAAVVTGNPVRDSIKAIMPPDKRFQGRDGRLRLLVLGGSLGAQAFNQIVPVALERCDPQWRPEIWHQTGHKGLNLVTANYATHDIKARCEAFVEDIAEAYAWADIILCRAGATTVAELMIVGMAAVLVPYPSAVDDHQARNGKYLVDAGAAIMVRQEVFTAESLAELLQGLREQGRSNLLAMAQAARTLGKPTATEQVALECLEVYRDYNGTKDHAIT